MLEQLRWAMSEEVTVDNKLLNWAAKATLVTILLVIWQGASGISQLGYSVSWLDLGSMHGRTGEIALLVAIAVTVLVIKSKTESKQLRGMAFGLPTMFVIQIALGHMMIPMPWTGMLHTMMALGIMSHATILWSQLRKVDA